MQDVGRIVRTMLLGCHSLSPALCFNSSCSVVVSIVWTCVQQSVSVGIYGGPSQHRAVSTGTRQDVTVRRRHCQAGQWVSVMSWSC